MSRIGKKPIEIPAGLEIIIEGQQVKVKGPKGQLTQEIPGEILVEKKDGQILLSPKKEAEKLKQTSALWGLSRALLQNCLLGAGEGFQKQLELVGVGYRAALEGEKGIVLNLGFSQPLKMAIPEGLNVKIEKNIITITGIDKQKVGQFSAEIRAKRKPEPYKGKGVRYVGEKVRRKEGKKAATAAA